MPILLIVLFLVATGCGNAQTTSSPQAQANASLKEDSVNICEKDEKDIPVSTEAQKHYVRLNDEIPSQDTDYVDCDGKVVATAHDPIRTYQDIVELNANKQVQDQIRFVEVENLRTCSTERVDVVPNKELFAGLRVKQRGAVFIGQHFTQASDSGRVRIAVTDLPYKLFGQTNIAQGFNIIQVRYFAECSKYREVKDDKRGEAYNCLEARLLGQLELAVDLNITRPSLAGKRQVSVCADRR